jgi:filamentous hemagglutinin family protein
MDQRFRLITLFFIISIDCKLVSAEVIPDTTLGKENTIVTSTTTKSGVITEIKGGAQRNNNLFQSLLKLNIYSGDQLNIINQKGIDRILIRVTGGSSTTIDGVLNSVGKADIFILNQNGLLINKNAVFNIGGSLALSTSTSINFSDGYKFISSGISTQDLSSAQPVSLSFNNYSQEINIFGNGNFNNQSNDVTTNSLIKNNTKDGSIYPGTGKNILLAGNGINLYGGIISNDTGNISIESIQNGDLDFYNLNSYSIDHIDSFADIKLDGNSAIFSRGDGAGSITLDAKNIYLNESSTIEIGNYGSRHAGNIKLYGKEDIIFSNDINNFTKSGILSENVSSGKGPSIFINANNLSVKSSSNIATTNYLSGTGGDIFINLSNNLTEISLTNTATKNTLIGTFSFGSGNAGYIDISTRNINLYNGSNITSNSFGLGSNGLIKINNSGDITIDGYTSIDFLSSSINSSTFSSANAAGLNIFTTNLYITNGGRVSSSTFNSGNGGNVLIKATGTVFVTGPARGFAAPSRISASAIPLNPQLQRLYKTPSVPSGNPGNLTITANSLRISEGGQITTQNAGLGKGGDILLNSNDTVLRQNSSISGNAGSNGNGGNITLNTGAFAADRSSSVLAQAIRGKGGNISINAGGIIGNPRISASSELGVDGTVQVRGDTLKRQDSVKASPKLIISPFTQKCIPGSEEGKLIGVTRDFINDEVLDNLAARPEQVKFVDDTDGGKIKPLIRERGYIKRIDGEFEFVYMIPADAIISSAQNQSACALMKSVGERTTVRTTQPLPN